MRLTRMFIGASAIAALVALSAIPAAAEPTVSGRAFAVSADVSAVYNALNLHVPAIPLATYPAGADKSVLSADLGSDPTIAKLHVLHGSSGIEHGRLVSHADLTDVSILGLIQASVLDADCTADSHGVRGTSDIVDLKIGALGSLLKNVQVIPTGQPVRSTATVIQVNANTPLPLNTITGNLLGSLTGNAITVTFGEQVRTGATLTVNALHIHVDTTKFSLLGLHLLNLGDLVKTNIIIGQAVCTQGTVPADPGGSTAVGNPGPTTAGQPTSGDPKSTAAGSAPTATSGPAASTTSTAVAANASATKNLAFTGVSGVVPMIVGAVVLVGAGGGLFWFSRRRRTRPGTNG